MAFMKNCHSINTLQLFLFVITDAGLNREKTRLEARAFSSLITLHANRK